MDDKLRSTSSSIGQFQSKGLLCDESILDDRRRCCASAVLWRNRRYSLASVVRTSATFVLMHPLLPISLSLSALDPPLQIRFIKIIRFKQKQFREFCIWGFYIDFGRIFMHFTAFITGMDSFGGLHPETP